MAWNIFKGTSGKGLAIGIAAVALAPVVVIAAKPLARAALKTGIIAYERGREALAEVSEVIDDIVAEVRSELEAEKAIAHAEETDAESEEALQAQAESPDSEVSEGRR